jgi:hypothetical protein
MLKSQWVVFHELMDFSDVLKIFVNSSWAHFAKIQTDIYLDIVRESYANLTLKEDNLLPNLSCHKYD